MYTGTHTFVQWFTNRIENLSIPLLRVISNPGIGNPRARFLSDEFTRLHPAGPTYGYIRSYRTDFRKMYTALLLENSKPETSSPTHPTISNHLSRPDGNGGFYVYKTVFRLQY
jgi:hypothetical protein